MGRHVVLSPAAVADLGQIRDWLTQPGAGERARRRLTRITDAIRTLPEFPYRGPAYPAVPHARILVIKGHAIIYRVRTASIAGAVAAIEVARIYAPGRHRP